MEHLQEPGNMPGPREPVPTRLPARRTPKPLAAPTTPLEMLALAVQKGASVEQLEKLMDLKDRHEAKEAQKAFVAAMAVFKQNPPRIEKTRTAKVTSTKGEGSSYSYKFANLADVCEQVVQALAKVGISHDWSTEQKDSFVAVTCTLTHELGHSKSTRLASGLDISGGKNSLQALGSAVSYLERYTLLAACGLAVDDEQDDDGAGITDDERAELRREAGVMRQRHRPNPAELASRGKAEPASEQLLQAARAAADKGHTHFGKYWREILSDVQRTQLGPHIGDLTDRANAASAQAAAAGK